MFAYPMDRPVNPEEREMELQRLRDEKMGMERTIELIRTYGERATINKKARENIMKAYCRAISEIEKRIDEIEG